MSMTLNASPENEFLLPWFGCEDGGAIDSVQQSLPNSYLSFKWVLDFCLAALLLIAAAPILLLCALLVKLTSRGPAFYSQVRLGRWGRPYWIYKLRTMYHLCEARSGPQWSIAGDMRITPLGRFLRNTHLDELPQLWNILRGEMSLVGPRPERPEFIPALTQAVPLYALRMLVRPGVTGLAQVQLHADTNLDSVRVKVAYDLHYIQQANLWIDVRILAATVFKVFFVSFEILRKSFLLPTQAVVETHYQALQQSTPAGPTRQEPAATTQLAPELVPAP